MLLKTPQAKDILFLVLLFGVLFTVLLGHRPLATPDEGRYAELPREMLEKGDFITPRLNGVKYFEKPPLFYWLEAFTLKIFGPHEFGLRLLPALLALFGCLGVYWVGSHIFGRTTGFLSALILGTSLLYFGLSQLLILDMAVSVFISAALLSYKMGAYQATLQARRRYYLWTYLFCALATLTKGLIGFCIPGGVVLLWIIAHRRWDWIREILFPRGILLFLGIAMPWHVWVALENPEFMAFYFFKEHALRLTTKVHGRYQPVWFFIPIFIGGFFPWISFFFQAVVEKFKHAKKQEKDFDLFLILWIGLVFTLYSFSQSKLIPYILPLFPAASLIVGRYLTPVWEGRSLSLSLKKGVRLGYFLYSGACLTLTALLIGFVCTPHSWINTQALVPFARGLSVCLFLSSFIVPWIGLRSPSPAYGLKAMLSLTVILLNIANLGAPLIQRPSVKPIAEALLPRLKPEDHVLVYHTYYQDLPFYLKRKVSVVGWKGELDFGTQVEDTTSWMLDEEAFWKIWQGPEQAYVITRASIYKELETDPRFKPQHVMLFGSNVLATNR